MDGSQTAGILPAASPITVKTSAPQYRIRSVAMCKLAFRKVGPHHALQTSVLRKLPPKQDVMHAVKLCEWDGMLADPRHISVQIHSNKNQLVGQAIVLLPDREHPDADMVDMNMTNFDPSTVATFRTVMTHPDHQGRGLMQTLLQECHAVADRAGRRHRFGVITRTNSQSWVPFLKAGMNITGCGFDESDGSTVYYAHQDSQQRLNLETKAVPLSPHATLGVVREFFNKGWVGVAGEKCPRGHLYTGRLMMRRRVLG